jgi:methylenetetrahydrofolate reductase (NADPH)
VSEAHRRARAIGFAFSAASQKWEMSKAFSHNYAHFHNGRFCGLSAYVLLLSLADAVRPRRLEAMEAAEISPSTRLGERIRRLLVRASFETTARPQSVTDVIEASLPRDASVYITALPGIGHDAVVSAAIRLRQAGLNPVPHLAARSFTGADELDGLLRRLTAEAGVSDLLVIGGDIDRPAGPFASSLDLLESGALARHGIRRVGVAGYPEPHPRLPAEIVEAALAAKIAHARATGIAVRVVTQFCFAPEPIRLWLERFSARFPDIPVHVGVAGPARASTLLKYGIACGIGSSLRALRRNHGLGKLLLESDPTPLIHALAPSEAKIAQFHLFPFGGIHRTAQWVRDFAA